MKGKSLTVLSLFVLFSSTAYAMEIYKGRLIKHTEHVSPGVKLSFQSIDTLPEKVKKMFQMTKPHQSKNEDEQVYSNLATSISPATAVTGKISYMNGYNYLYISNYTNDKKSFAFYVEQCVALDEHHFLCADTFDQFELEPKGYVATFGAPVLQVMFKNSGTYETHMYSSLTTGYNTLDSVVTANVSSSTIYVNSEDKK